MNIYQSVALSDTELTRFFLAIIIFLVFAHFWGYFFQHFKLPRVIGEIFGGLLLGSGGLGFYFPALHHWLFQDTLVQGKLISSIYWFGLILLMFISGFAVQKRIVHQDRKIIVAAVLGSTLIPFIAGWYAPILLNLSSHMGSANNITALRLVIGIAVAVTSIPVISRIFLDLDILNTRFAKIVLSTATIHDVILWIALAIASGLVSTSGLSGTQIIVTVVCTLLFFCVSIWIAPVILNNLSQSRYNLILKSSRTGFILLVCLFFSTLANLLSVNIIFGAFLAGIVIGSLPQEEFAEDKNNIREFALAFFIPIYFAIVGFRLDLMHHLDITLLLTFLTYSTFFITFGTILFLCFVRINWFSRLNIAIAMNTRGGPGIVLATIAFDLCIINETLFVTLVLIALITSLLAGIWFRYITVRGIPLLVSQE